jgi:hypothetical protein
MKLRGRHMFFFWLLAVCTALWLVIWRQTASFRLERALDETRSQRTMLQGRTADLQRRIRAASSRDDLIPRAARLGLREAKDSEIFRIPPPLAP